MKKKVIVGMILIICSLLIVFNSVEAYSGELDPKSYITLPSRIYVENGVGTGKISLSSRATDYTVSYQKVDITQSQFNNIKTKMDEVNKYIEESNETLKEKEVNLKDLQTKYQTLNNSGTATTQEIEEAYNKYIAAHEDYKQSYNLIDANATKLQNEFYALVPNYTNSWKKTTGSSNNIELDFANYSGTIYFVLWAKITNGTDTYYDMNIYSSIIEKEEVVTIDKSSASIKVEESLQLTAKSSTNSNITWTSSDNSIVTVTSTGLVKGVKEGSAIITAKGSEKTATCTVTVSPIEKEEVVTIDKSSANIKIEESLQLTAKSSTNSNITWTSSNNSIVTVTSTGLVKGIKEGSAIITAKGSKKTATCTVTVSPKEIEKWTDFTNAKFELKKDGISGAMVQISNVVPNEKNSYYLIITSNSSKPNVTSKSDECIALSYKSDKKAFVTMNNSKVARYVELNQDLYVSIIEKAYQDEKVVTFGKKLERFAEPKYSDAFHATFMTHDGDQIVTAFTHAEQNNRKIQIKIGKITDKAILQKIKKQDASGFANLLSFAKSNKGIYDKTVDADKNDWYAIEYNAGTDRNNNSVIDLKGLQDDEYYFLYIKTDDENGKYITQEAVTLAQADVNSNKWWLFFYGSSDFKWADFENVSADNSSAPGVLPQTGSNALIVLALSIVVAGAGAFSYIQYRKNNF